MSKKIDLEVKLSMSKCSFNLLISSLLLFVLTGSICAEERPMTETECLEQGGIWARRGLLPVETCSIPTKDAGKTCSSSKECESICIADQTKDLKTGDSATGTCYPQSNLVGTCLARIEEGKVQPRLCLD